MEWFKRTVFQDEAVQPRRQEGEEPLPAPIRAARSLAEGTFAYRQSRESLFVMQAKVLVNYEDDYVYDEPVLHYYPTYQSLTDPGGRSYAGEMFKKRLCPTHFFTSTSFSTKSASQILWTATRN